MRNGKIQKQDGELLKWLYKQCVPINERGQAFKLNATITMSEAVTLYALGNKLTEIAEQDAEPMETAK